MAEDAKEKENYKKGQKWTNGKEGQSAPLDSFLSIIYSLMHKNGVIEKRSFYNCIASERNAHVSHDARSRFKNIFLRNAPTLLYMWEEEGEMKRNLKNNKKKAKNELSCT